VEFEWDENKNQENIRDRGIDFRDMINIFLDPFYIEEEDTRRDHGEQRFKVIGEVNGRVLVVVYTYRGEKIRIISARKAEPYERRKYYQSYP
jgi:uncharacterized DUF497 family protein